MLGLDHGVAPEILLDPGHGPGGRLRRGEQRTAAVLVERAPTTVQALGAVQACPAGEAGVTEARRVPAALPLQGRAGMGSILPVL